MTHFHVPLKLISRSVFSGPGKRSRLFVLPTSPKKLPLYTMAENYGNLYSLMRYYSGMLYLCHGQYMSFTTGHLYSTNHRPQTIIQTTDHRPSYHSSVTASASLSPPLPHPTPGPNRMPAGLISALDHARAALWSARSMDRGVRHGMGRGGEGDGRDADLRQIGRAQ